MTSKLRRVATLAMVAVLALSVAGMALTGGVAAATDTLAGDGSDQVTGFEANASNDIETSIAADGTDFDTDGSETLKMNVSYDGTEYAMTTADVADGTSASQTINLSNDELSDLPGDAGANTTVEVTTWGVNADGNVTTNATSFNVDITFDDTHAVRTVHSTNDSIVSGFESASSDDDGLLGGFSISSINPLSTSSLDTTATVEDTIGVNGTQTEIQVYSQDSDMTDALDSATESTESGDRVGYLMTSTLDGQALRVYDSEPGAKFPGGENVTEGEDTYAVYNGDGHMTVHLGEDRFDSDTSEVDMSINSGEDVGASTLQEDLGYGMLEAWGLSLGSLSLPDWIPGVGMIVPAGGALAVLIPAGRRRLFS